MPTVEVLVNGRRHVVQCGEGEEARVKRLASYVDRRVTDLARGALQVGDSRLLIMASIMVADELSDAFDEIKRLQSLIDEKSNASEQQAAAAIARVAHQLDAIAAQLDKT
ncbi:MAG: cell division protein ZapA [Geminicoccaceae bacterium]|nr:cell division protein ZapA [Geminicoccaceae bacterium]